MGKKNDIKYFIEKSNEIHDNKYTYVRSVYINSQTKLIITCPNHGDFKQIPNAHMSGQGCPKCSSENSKLKYTTDIFIEKSIKVHNNKYDYSKVNYIDSRTKVIIICNEHGEFEQNPTSHLMGYNCRKCSSLNRKSYPLEYYIKKANEKHNYKYDYSSIVDYKNPRTNVTITCPKGHKFEQTMKDHKRKWV